MKRTLRGDGMKSKHRKASHAKRAAIHRLPKFWEPKTPETDKLTCKIAHHHNVEEIRKGGAGVDILLEWAESIFTYSEMMKLYVADGIDISEEAGQLMADQLLSCAEVADRYNRTGKVGFNAEQLNIAKATAFLMDDLIALDRHGIAVQALINSSTHMAALRKQVAHSMLVRGQEVAA